MNEMWTSLHSVVYFFILKTWSLVSFSEGWLRSLSAVFGILSVAFNFFFFKKFFNERIAFGTSLLLATSPFLIFHAQQIRFYTIFLFGSYFSFWYALKYLEKLDLKYLIKLLLVHAILFFTHGISGLLLVSVLLGIFLASPKISAKIKSTITIAGLCSLVLVLQWPSVRAIGFDLFAKYTNAIPGHIHDRHLSLISLLKFPLTFYIFSLGNAVYPISLAGLSILIYLVFFIRGTLSLVRNKTHFIFFSTVILFSSISLYLVLDVLCPSTYASASPRYLIFLLPIFYFFIVVGFFKKWHSLCLLLLLAVNAVSLSQYWGRQWSYADDLINWRDVTRQLGNYVDSKTTIFLDGRSHNIAKWYFPKKWAYKSFDSGFANDLHSGSLPEKVIVISFDYHKNARSRTTQAIRDLAEQYVESAVMAKYPLIVYVFEKKYSMQKEQQSLSFPKEIYGLEFQDVRFPAALSSSLKKFISTGIAEVNDEIKIENPKGGILAGKSIQSLSLFSNVISQSKYPTGKVLAEVIIFYEDRSTQSFEMRKGIETNQWNESCQAEDCSVAFSWTKKIAFLGSQRYPQSAKHFNAHVFSHKIVLDNNSGLVSVHIKNAMPEGKFYIWGIGIE